MNSSREEGVQVERHCLRYVGPPAVADLFVLTLEDEGASVVQERQREQQGVPGETVVVDLVSRGSAVMIEAAVGKIRERWPKVEIEWRG